MAKMAANANDDALKTLLHAHFGYSTFRPFQLDAINAVISGQDVLLVLPTGGGKSLAFQFPSLLRSQVTVVITPLLALAKDQVENANENNIEAASWSSLTSEAQKESLARDIVCEDGTLRLLYTTPESLQTEKLLDVLTAAHEAGRLCSLAIDEAHAVSEWGHDFRSSYLSLGDVRSKLPGLPCISVTATATPQVRASIINILKLQDPKIFLGSFNRPELEFTVVHKELIGDGSQDAIVQDIVRIIHQHPGQSGIVYCRLRATCDEVASALCDFDIDAASYHAGLDPARRSRVQQEWKEGSYDVVVATIAFGMGIDKANVRYVIHIDPPASLEGLYQEAGRGGRDGQPAISVVYASNEDLRKAQKMERGERGGATAAVADYIQSAGCRRQALLAHFSERRGPRCVVDGEQLCDYCQSPRGVTAKLAALEEKLEAAAVALRAAEAGHMHDNNESSAAEDPYDRADPGSDLETGNEDVIGEAGKAAVLLPRGAAGAVASMLRPLPPRNGTAISGTRVTIPAKRKPPLPTMMTSRQLEALTKGEKVAPAAVNRSSEVEPAAKLQAVSKPKRRAFNAPRRIQVPEK